MPPIADNRYQPPPAHVIFKYTQRISLLLNTLYDSIQATSRTQNNTWQICKHLKVSPLQGTSTLDTTALQLQIALALVQ